MGRLLAAVYFIIASFAAMVEPACAKVVHLYTLEWPPYTTQSDGHGGSDAVVRAAFAAMGYEVDVHYVPWQRAIAGVRHDPSVDGVFPAYQSDERDSYCHWSHTIGQSPVGFAERSDAPISWQTLDDLAPIQLGAVQGFVNTLEFDARVANGALSVEKTTDDAANLRKLLAGRIQAAVIDRNVMRYMMASDPELRGKAAQLRFNAHLLETKPLFVCFRKDPAGAVLAADMDEGLKKIDAATVAARAMESLGW